MVIPHPSLEPPVTFQKNPTIGVGINHALGLLGSRKFVEQVQFTLTVGRLAQFLVNLRQHVMAARIGGINGGGGQQILLGSL